LGLMVGLGVWGVLAASSSASDAKRDDARAAGVDAATGLEVSEMELQGEYQPLHVCPCICWSKPVDAFVALFSS